MFPGWHRSETLASTYLMTEDAQRDSLDARDYLSTMKKCVRLTLLSMIERVHFLLSLVV